MTLDEIKDGDFFMIGERTYKATDKAQGYKRICISLYDGDEVLIDRDTEVCEVIK